ncbi:hypothetical protein [Photorhabdus temperata]|uniref:hypothetical protein n=1 Tax=Photorhabdus temperata TaxID=574560 RepID=UPI000389EC80|nr:hypothetical protein [Photorhabdus temperata]EQB99972.1 hypothetical protein B738_13945 [Photorhabdus temperata subsp. temperata M1021]
MKENIELDLPSKNVTGLILSLEAGIATNGGDIPNNAEITVKQNNGKQSKFFLRTAFDNGIIGHALMSMAIYNTLLSSFQKGTKVTIFYEEKDTFKYIRSVKTN